MSNEKKIITFLWIIIGIVLLALLLYLYNILIKF